MNRVSSPCYCACLPGSGLRRKGAHIADGELQRIMEEMDVDGSGMLDFEEFLTATVWLGKLERRELLMRAFSKFDRWAAASLQSHPPAATRKHRFARRLASQPYGEVPAISNWACPPPCLTTVMAPDSSQKTNCAR